MKPSEKIYARYEYLAKKYASKIFSYEELSFEYEDLVQEFKIKIFTSIKSYGRRWAKFRKGEAPKPVPIKFYLEAACGNRMRDFMKYISREKNKIRIDNIDYDYGVHNETNIIPEKNVFIVNGVDLLEGLTGKERVVFSLFLRGCENTILNKVYFNSEQKKNKKVADIIEKQKSYLLEKYGNELTETRKIYSSYNFEK